MARRKLAGRNFIDAVVGFFSPSAGLRRSIARDMLTRAYEGASKKDGWRPRRPGASADADHQADAPELRARARALVHSVPYIAEGLRSLVAQTIGTGIMPRWGGRNAKRIAKLWNAHARFADADGRTNVYGLQAKAYRAMEQDGEVLVRIRSRRPSDGLPVPLQYQLLEIDWLDSHKNERRGTNEIVNGIEYDALGRRVAYWLFDEHPGGITQLRPGANLESRPVPAAAIIHLFTAERPGQGRGITRFAPVIGRVRDLQLYEDAEAQRKNLESRLAVLASGGDAADLADPAAAGGTEEGAATGELGALAGGQIMQMPPGMSFHTVEPKAAPGYVDYVKLQLHMIAAGAGITYEMLTGDMSEVNFSSARVRQNDFRRQVEMTQWLTVIPTLCDAMCQHFVEHAFLAGLLDSPEYEVEHTPPKWNSPNPLQDVQADLAEIAGGLSSWSEKIRQRGYQPSAVFEELKTDVARLAGDGTLDVMMLLQKARVLTEVEQAEEPKDKAKDPA